MRERGKIVGVNGSTARVQINQGESSAEGCIKHGAGNNFYVTAQNPIDAKQGQSVEVSFSHSCIICTALLVFWTPLLLGVAGYWIGSMISSSMAISTGLCILGVLISVFPILAAENKMSKDNGNIVITSTYPIAKDYKNAAVSGYASSYKETSAA